MYFLQKFNGNLTELDMASNDDWDNTDIKSDNLNAIKQFCHLGYRIIDENGKVIYQS
ncbi:hypothetical protein [Paenibacillus elgii]|uniref:hypothetical protein n=1 Tax=Paenibacillus elgii TaxID=189691 RepID=UPI00203C7D50|nr:hypothetical protein [Paenibacillus elgii]MCM3273064.1 hypothetical protein [Paenibacillus elgii]